MSEGYLQKIVITNLKKIAEYYEINSIEKLAEIVEVKSSTIISWFSYKRGPKIKTLDKISDKLNIQTHILFQDEFQPNSSMIIPGVKNNSRESLDSNLKKEYGKLSKKSWSEVSSIYSGFLSIDTLKSYHRGENSITPPIKTLEKLSSYLGVPASELIKDVKNEEDR